MLVTCQRFGDLFLFGLVWQYSSIQKNIIKVESKSWILTCSCHVTLSLPFYTEPASKRELNFCNGYLSLLYFWIALIAIPISCTYIILKFPSLDTFQLPVYIEVTLTSEEVQRVKEVKATSIMKKIMKKSSKNRVKVKKIWSGWVFEKIT